MTTIRVYVRYYCKDIYHLDIMSVYHYMHYRFDRLEYEMDGKDSDPANCSIVAVLKDNGKFRFPFIMGSDFILHVGKRFKRILRKHLKKYFDNNHIYIFTKYIKALYKHLYWKHFYFPLWYMKFDQKCEKSLILKEQRKVKARQRMAKSYTAYKGIRTLRRIFSEKYTKDVIYIIAEFVLTTSKYQKFIKPKKKYKRIIYRNDN